MTDWVSDQHTHLEETRRVAALAVASAFLAAETAGVDDLRSQYKGIHL